MKLKNLLITILSTLIILPTFAGEEEGSSYSIEIPQELAKDMEKFSITNFGKLENFTFFVATENDNLGHGLGGAVGIRHSSDFEGDDLGKTFAIDVNLLLEYENAEIAIEFFSDLYSRFSLRELENGELTEFNENGKTRTENINYEGVRAKITKDLQNKYFLTFEVEAAREADENGLAIHIQNFFHHTSRNLENAAGGRAVQYEQIDHMKTRGVFSSAIGAGKTFKIYNSKKLLIENKSEVGIRISTDEWRNELYIESRLALKKGRSNLYFDIEKGSKETSLYGVSFEYDLIKKKNKTISTHIGVYRENNEYNRLFPDRIDHSPDARIRPKNDLIYKYGIKAKF